MFNENIAALCEITGKKHLHQESLANSLSVIEGGGSWLSHLSHLTRALVVYNADIKGAALVIMACFEMNSICFDKNELVRSLIKIDEENLLDIPKITGLIKNVMQ
jgi:hypothetical protein